MKKRWCSGFIRIGGGEGSLVGVFLLVALMAIGGPVRAEEQASPISSKSRVSAIRELFEQGRWREGISALRQVPESEEEPTDLTLLRAGVALETADYAEAFRLYQRLLARFPNDAGIKNNLAWIRLHTSDPTIRDLNRALDEARDAVFQRPSDPNIWNTLAEIYLARGEREKALRLAILARDMARAIGIEDLRIFDATVSRSAEKGSGTTP